MVDLAKQLNSFMQSSLGIEVVDVRVKKIDLPSTVSEPVFTRMRSEREREAQEHRAEGEEQAAIIRADADRQRTVIEADAYRQAEILRGEGDAQAASIYAEAYNRDPEFYSFIRSLNAYKETFNNGNDIILIEPDNDFFRYLNERKKR